jgi:hypothetical protein
MTRNFSLFRIALALVCVPVIFGLVYGAGYRSVFPSNWDLVLLAACVIAGVWTLYRLPFTSTPRRVGACVVYAVAMSAVLLALSLWIACGQGTCL